MRLTFHRDCEKFIFNRISWNTSLNRMGLVSLWSRSKILSYELKLIFSSFGQIFIVCAWIFAHVHKVWEFEKLWITLGLEIKYMTYPYAYSSFQKDFLTCNFQAIFLWPFTSPQVGSWWKVHKMSYTHPNLIMSVSRGSMWHEEEMGKNPFWYF